MGVRTTETGTKRRRTKEIAFGERLKVGNVEDDADEHLEFV